MSRAASRLNSKKNSSKGSNKTKTKLTKTLKKILDAYLFHSPTLIAALVFSGLTYFIATNIEPAQIRNWLLPNTYLPLLLSVFISGFFWFSYILLSSRRGFLLAIAAVIFLFLYLQQTIITASIVAAILAPILVIEIIVSLIKFISQKF